MSVQLYYRKGTPIQGGRIEKCLEALMNRAGKGGAHLEINLVGSRKIREWNREYRHKDKVTDVLSFPQDLKAPHRGVPWILGEIVIAVPVAKVQAKRSGRNLSAQITRLALHGLVHLLGLDHERGGAERKRFETREKNYLRYLQEQGLMAWDGSLQF